MSTVVDTIRYKLISTVSDSRLNLPPTKVQHVKALKGAERVEL